MSSIFPSDDWTLAQGEIDGSPVVIRMRSTLPSIADCELHSRLLIVSWAYTPNESRMPESDIHSRMNTLEDALESGTEKRGIAYQAVSLTGGGEKQWRYYASDTDQFLESLNEDLAGYKPFPIEIRDFDDPDWNGLKEFTTELGQ